MNGDLGRVICCDLRLSDGWRGSHGGFSWRMRCRALPISTGYITAISVLGTSHRSAYYALPIPIDGNQLIRIGRSIGLNNHKANNKLARHDRFGKIYRYRKFPTPFIYPSTTIQHSRGLDYKRSTTYSTLPSHRHYIHVQHPPTRED